MRLSHEIAAVVLLKRERNPKHKSPRCRRRFEAPGAGRVGLGRVSGKGSVGRAGAQERGASGAVAAEVLSVLVMMMVPVMGVVVKTMLLVASSVTRVDGSDDMGDGVGGN